MQCETVVAGAPYHPEDIMLRRWHPGQTLLASGTRWIVLLLALAILVPWPRSWRSVPAMKPSHRAPGSSPNPIVSLAFGADGQTLATTDESGLAMLWPAAEGWGPPQTLAFPGWARVAAFSVDGHYLAIGGDEPQVALWNLRKREWEHTPRITLRSPSDLKFSPDGRTLAVSSHDSPQIVLWDLAAGRERLILKGHTAAVIHMAFAADGRSLASAAGEAADSPIRIWNLADGTPKRRVNGLSSAVQAMAYSPDSRLLATACSHEKVVRIWDVLTGGQVQEIAGHTQPTRSVAFSPDGRLLATAAGDGSAGLWSVATGRDIRRLDGQADVLRNVAFSPDGLILAATANDGDIRFWDLDDLIGDLTDH
jgi:WD40 repeat protein